MRGTRPMDWAEFEKTVEWARLSVRQQFWLRTYLESGEDRVLATRCAYETSGKENTRIFSYEVRKHRAIQEALNRYFNLSRRDIWLQELQAELKTMKPGSAARLKLLRLITKVLAGGKIPKRSKRK